MIDRGNTVSDEFAERTKESLRDLALAHLRNATVVLFGSRAKGTEHRRSDFDIGYIPREGFDPLSTARLREAIEDSDVIYEVDLVDLSHSNASLREKAMKEGAVWRS